MAFCNASFSLTKENEFNLSPGGRAQERRFLDETKLFWLWSQAPHSRIPAGPCDDGVMATHDPLELRDMRRLFWCKLFWCTQDERVCFWEDVCRTSVANCCSLCHPAPMDHLTISSARTQPLMCLQRASRSVWNCDVFPRARLCHSASRWKMMSTTSRS